MEIKIKVMLLMEEGYIRDSIRVILSITDEIILAGETDNIETCLDLTKTYKPHIIIVGEEVKDVDGFLLSRKIIDAEPFQSIIYLASKPNVDTYKNALSIGIKEVLKTPLYPDEFKNAITRVYNSRERVSSSMTQRDMGDSMENEQKKETGGLAQNGDKAHIISIFSIKGGVGKTTISTNLAAVLAEKGKKTVLLDLDIYSGDVALAMNIIPKRRITDLANDISRLDVDLLESYMVKHPSGLMVFTAPFNIEHADYIKPEHIEKILSLLEQEYDYIIIDCPSYFYDIAMMALERSDQILLIATMDIISLKSIKNTMAVLENLKIDRSKMSLVLNKYMKGVGLTINDIEATLSMPVTTVIPLDSQPVISSMNQGVPFVTGAKRSKVAKAVQSLGKGILVRAGDE